MLLVLTPSFAGHERFDSISKSVPDFMRIELAES